MKDALLLLTICCTINQIVLSQITNTFPINDSVGIGTATPSALFEVSGGDAVINYVTVGYGSNFGGTTLGNQALSSNISGTNNTAIGEVALENNLSGSWNTAVGNISMKYNLSGYGNTATGFNTLVSNKSGYYNTAIGLASLILNTTGFNNVAIGANAMYKNLKGNNNAALGYNSLYFLEKGMNNTACGTYAFYTPTKGNNNTAVGYYTDMSGNFSNATAIGAEAIVDASNKVRIGNSSIISNGGQVEWTAYSDARIKNNIKENVPGLEFINLLKPVTYHFDVDKQNEIMGVSNTEEVEGMYDIEKIQWTGFIAQDVEAAAKNINYDFSGLDKSGEIMGLRYSSFVVPMVKAIQELSRENEELRMENEELKMNDKELENRISKLEKRFAKNNFSTLDTEYENVQQIKLSEGEQTASLSQNIPNPFTGKTTIQYYVPETAQSAQIKIV
ncbi:MAG: tail fiber domain-containing protein, partial [Bacteroidia bacterium]